MIGAEITLRSVLDRLDRVEGPDRRGWYKSCCPFHDDRTPSFGIHDHGFNCLGCGKSGSLRDLVHHFGIEEPATDSAGERYRTYDYCDERDVLLYQTVRKQPKGFFQRRPDGQGGWVNNLKGVRLVPYRLPEILSAPPEQALFVVEGEKDADRLWVEGAPATTNPMGAGKWRAEYDEHFRDRLVVIVPDNDETGRRHTADVASQLYGIAASVRVLTLNELPAKGDVSDWLDGGRSVDDLRELAAAAPAWHPADAHDPVMVPTRKPDIIISERALHEISDDGWDALQGSHQLYRHGRVVADVSRDDDGRPRITHLSVAALRGKVDRAATWLRMDKNGEHPVAPPKAVIEDMLALPDDLPVIRGIVGTPTFAADGTLDTHPGYQRATKLFYEPSGEPLSPIPQQPDASDLRKAKLIFQELLGDFPFADESSRAHAIAVPITAAAREMIDGPTPLFAFDAPTPGTGKTILGGCLGLIVSGAPPALTTHTKSEDEMRKRITAFVIAAAPVVLLDNVKRRLTSETLAGVLTTTTWADRVLGKSEYVDLPIRTIWMVTGNNLELDTDIARRTVWIRLDAKVDMPWERSGFRNPLPDWAFRHRHELVWATLVLVRHWIASGRPEWSGALLGSYESWSRVVGGVLQCAGISGFLDNRAQLYKRMDPDTEHWRAFVRDWWEQFGDQPVKVADLYPLADEIIAGLAGRNGDPQERALRSRLGWALTKRRDRRIGDLTILKDEGDTHEKVNRWRLELAGDLSDAGDLPADSPRDNESTSDSFAGVAGDCGYEFGVGAIAGGEGVITQKENEGQTIPRNPPQPPQTDSNPPSKPAGDVREDSVMTSKPPQDYRCVRCRMPMASNRVSDVCGWCKKEAT